jgi:Beta-propeller repeat
MRAYVPTLQIAMLGLMVCATVNAGAQKASDSLNAQAAFARLPLMFEVNQGQGTSNSSFTARGPGYSFALSADRILLVLQPSDAKEDAHASRELVDVQIEGADPTCKPQGVDELPGKANYFIGADPTKWRVGVRTFSKVKYENVYPGIDLVFYGTGREIEYDLVVHPGADPNRIRFSIKGQTSSTLEDSGALALSTRAGTIRFRAPEIYQGGAESRQSVGGHFKVVTAQSGQSVLSFAVESYDHSRTLVIDPILDYSTYLGGSAYDWASGVAVDNAGNAYLAGTTSSLDFPVTPGAVFPDHAGCFATCYDSFVAKISTTGGGLEYATYLGGGGDDFAYTIAIDLSGNAYIVGSTNSTDFPTTNSFQRSCGGTCYNSDAFVVKLNPTGSALVYSTYLGGSGEDVASGIAVRNNHAYVSGFSSSTDFPVTPGAFQTNMQGQGSSFVVELNVSATAETFGTFLGEADLSSAGGSIAVDAAGNSYVAGTTLSANFPQTPGAFHTPFLPNFQNNMYILKLNPTGTALRYSALIGGAAPAGMALDAAGEVYVAGYAGPLSPVTPGALDQSCDNGVLVLKLNATGSNLLTAAHLCPDRFWPVGVAFDASQNIILSGYTDSPDLSTTVGAFRASKTNVCCLSDAVLGKLKADGSALDYLTYFGGNGSDSASAMAQDSAGNVYMAGYDSMSTNLPIKGGFQTTNAGSFDTFLAKLSLPSSALSVSPAVLTFPQEGIGNASPTINVTVANISSSSIAINSATTSGDFNVSSNGCGADLPAGDHCVITVGFNPTAPGSRSGILTITDGIGVQEVRLSGAGVFGPLVAFPSAYQVNTAVGIISPPFAVTITNTGNKTLNISQISLMNDSGFDFGAITCFKPIAPLDSCTVNVTYSAFGVGYGYAALTLTDNASGSPHSFGLMGNAIGGGLIFTSVALRFGQQSVGTSSAPQQLTLINGTGADVTLNSIKAAGNFSQTSTCGATLAAGAYCYINVKFKPISSGIKQGGITVTDSASGSPLVVPLLGTGN